MADLRTRLKVLDHASVPDQWSEIEGRSPGHLPQPEPTPWRRVATATVAMAIAVAGTVFAVGALTPERDPGAAVDPTAWPVHEVRALSLTFRSPPDWYVQPFEEMVGHAGFAGAVVSNVDHMFRHPDLGANSHTSAWDLRGLPDDSVVISIQRVSALMVETNQADTPRPLRLDATEAQEAGGRYAATTWERRWLPFVLGGFHNTLQMAFGSEASEHDREIARQIVASIQPIPRVTLDGWTVEVDVDHAPSRTLQIEAGAVHRAPENEDDPWIEHTIVLRNTGDLPLHFNPSSVGAALGDPEQVLLAADEGCSFARVGKGPTREWAAACVLSMNVFTIPPHGLVERTVTLFKGLRGMSPLRAGTYFFEKAYRFRVGETEITHEVEVRLTYRIRRAA